MPIGKLNAYFVLFLTKLSLTFIFVFLLISFYRRLF